MRIAMIGQKGMPAHFGGIETHVSELSTRLVQSGHHVTVYARPWYQKDAARVYNGVRIVTLPSFHTKRLDTISHTFISILHATFVLRADVIHIHGVGPSILAWLPKLLRPVASVVTTFHCIDARQEKWGRFAKFMLRLGERFAVKAPDKTIAVSKSLQKHIRACYEWPAEYIPNGISPARASTNDAALRPHKLSSGQFVATIARLIPDKNIHVLIDAWKIAKQTSPKLMSGMKLAIVGDSAFTSEYVAKLHAMAAGDNSIVFTGFQTGATLKAIFAGSRAIAHPSKSEGLPITILEAMSYGKAVIASDIEANKEVVDEYGVIVPVNNAEALAEALIEVLEDPIYAASLGHSAREHVEMNYHWDDIARRVEAVYEEALPLRDGIFAIR